MNNVSEQNVPAACAKPTKSAKPGMVNFISPSSAERLRNFFLQAGYAEHAVARTLDLLDISAKQDCGSEELMERTKEQTALNVLLRWFWIGVPQEASAVKDLVPSRIAEILLEAGLLRNQGQQLQPTVMIIPAKGCLFVSDQRRSLDSGQPDLVLWPNPTSIMLSQFTVRRPSRATLDLGTGNGIQAVFASSHSERVVATDVSSRAVSFAVFNARLNGVENVEFLVGDSFEPVGSRKFDLVVSNPPFFITPSTRYVFCDNSLDLDNLCRKLARQAPSHLNEGGHFQMLCEWAEISGQSWQQRIAEWFHNTGCDAIVTRMYAREPATYARQYAVSTGHSREARSDLYSSHMAYFSQKNVVAIHGGVVSLRRRSAHNWLAMDDLKRVPKGPFGDSILNTFAARDFLQSHAADHQLLAAAVKLAPDARLEQVMTQEAGGWRAELLSLRLSTGLERSIKVRPLVAEFLTRCDGIRTLGEITGEFAAKVNAPAEQVNKECVDIVRKLVASGLMSTPTI